MKSGAVINQEEIKKEYSFYLEGSGFDKYFCGCGNVFDSKHEEDMGDLIPSLENDADDEMINLYKDIKLSLDEKIICPECDMNFSNPDNRMKLVPFGDNFISSYDFEESDENLIIYYSKLKAAKPIDESKEFEFVEDSKYIRFDKNSKELYFKGFGQDSKEKEFGLDASISHVNSFFELDVDKILNFYSLHMYVNRLANFVPDTNGSNIVDEFLSFIRNSPNSVGVNYIKKLLSIFYGIIKYSNLSTIALTKGSQFLYDLMVECEIPSSDEMIKSGATSPVGIFNFLVTKYINDLNKEVEEEDKESQDFAFKSKQKIEYEKLENKAEKDLKYFIEDEETDVNYIVRDNRNYKSGKVTNIDGTYQVLDAVKDGTISKFIYNHIETFSQYKQIIKYFKFYNKNQVISMLQKYDLELITKAIDIIYFRDKMEDGELDRVLQIIDSFVEGRFFFKDYDNVREFSFVEYDDARMMMEILKFNPARHFNKIKTYDKLVEYHDLLVSFYNAKNEEERTGDIKGFVDKFRYLEERGEDAYNGPLKLELHDSPGRIIKEGIDMRHSAGQYSRNVAKGDYLLGTIYDEDPNRPEEELDKFTVGFKYNSRDGLEFDQVKGFANKLGSNRLKNLVMDFLTEKDVSFRPIKDLKLSVENGDGEL